MKSAEFSHPEVNLRTVWTHELWDKEKLRQPDAVKSEPPVSIQNGEFGFKDPKRTRKLNFIQYLE